MGVICFIYLRNGNSCRWCGWVEWLCGGHKWEFDNGGGKLAANFQCHRLTTVMTSLVDSITIAVVVYGFFGMVRNKVFEVWTSVEDELMMEYMLKCGDDEFKIQSTKW